MREAALPYVHHTRLDDISSATVKALLYFDIFDYPLTFDEIKRFQPKEINAPNTLKSILNDLVSKGLVSYFRHFYFFGHHYEKVDKRLTGNLTAERMLKSAKWVSRFIQSFPFVRCVCISGSLSKGFMNEKSDIDFFIITKPNRLWIARTLLIAFKKFFLFNSSRYFCVNYLIDTDHLEIPDQNLFTATELLTLKPMTNPELFEDFLKQNTWAFRFLPNHPGPEVENIPNVTDGFLKRIFERFLNDKIGEFLDIWLMKVSLNRWKKKFPNLSLSDFDLALRSRRYVSKHHPQNFQNKVLMALEKKQLTFEATHRVKL